MRVLRNLRTSILTAVVVGILGMTGCANGATNTASWFQWHGPDRAGTISGTSGWPEGWPPRELWRTNVGFGASAPLLVNQRVYASDPAMGID